MHSTYLEKKKEELQGLSLQTATNVLELEDAETADIFKALAGCWLQSRNIGKNLDFFYIDNGFPTLAALYVILQVACII